MYLAGHHLYVTKRHGRGTFHGSVIAKGELVQLMDNILSAFREVVQILLTAGAAADDENKSGHTPTQLAAKFGHTEIISELAKHGVNMRLISRKIGLSALHVAAFYGETDATREMLTHVPAQIKSDLPSNMQASIAKVTITIT